MIDQELYIDGELMDMDEDTKVTLDIKSNIFIEVSKMTSNSSFTVKLPKTVRNQRIIGHSDLVTVISDYPYRVHSARYFRNGIEIISKGNAVVASVGDKIEICLVWGCFTNLKNIIDSGLELNGLDGDDKIWFTGNDDMEVYPNTKDYFYALIDFTKYSTEAKTTDTESSVSSWRENRGGSAPRHPVARVPFVLRLVKEQKGVEFEWGGTAKSMIDSLIIPLTERKANELTFGKNFEASFTDKNGYGELTYNIKNGIDSFNTTSGSGIYIVPKVDMKLRVSINGTFRYYYDAPAYNRVSTYQDVKIIAEVYDGTKSILGNNHSDYVIAIGRKITYNPSGNATGIGGVSGYYEVYYDGYNTIEIKQGYQMRMVFEHIYGGSSYVKTPIFKNASMVIAPNVPDEVPLNSYYPIIENLPDIKVIDLIKGLCAITGTFARQKSGKVEMISIDDIYSNLSKAKDWTKKVIAQSRENKPKEMEFKISDYARNNHFKWKEDDTVSGSYDGTMVVDNDVLDYEKDVITMPFAATDGNNIPIYTKNTAEDGTVTWNSSSVKPRLLKEEGASYYYKSRRETGDDLRSYGIFEGMDFVTILNDRYKRLNEILQRSKVIKEKMMVSEYDLKEFDESIPIYLGQYGRYFAVIEMKAEDSGVAEVQLLQL